MSSESKVYIALGANLGDPVSQLRQAIDAVAELEGFRLLACSSLYRTEPLGPPGQPDYFNAVMSGLWHGGAIALLDALQAIEADAGRSRSGERWSARVLDLDILLFGDETIATKRLTVPHYAMHERDFVLQPLAEIAPELVVPGQGKVADLVHQLPSGRFAPEKLS